MPVLTPAVIDTPRLRLRWITTADAAAQFSLFGDPVLRRYGGAAAWTRMEQAEESVTKALRAYEEGESLLLAITLPETGEVIGNTRLYGFHDQNRRCDIGYILAHAHQGKGYMLEALEATLQHAFTALDLNRIEADVDPRNHASYKLLERLGFRKEGYMPERWFVNGEWCDTINYGLLRRYWDEARTR